MLVRWVCWCIMLVMIMLNQLNHTIEKKHYGNTPTKKDRQVVGGSPDHDPPLVKRYYEGNPSIGEKPGYQMTAAERRASAQDRSRMNPSTKAEQNSQGGRMSKYSKEMKKKYGLDKND